MDFSEAKERLLPSFGQYYTVNKDTPTAPFFAEAEFRSHNEQYFLVRSAHIADIDSNEFVFFAEQPGLTAAGLTELCSQAWQDGLSRVKPYYGHRNSDVTLIILTDKADEAVRAQIKKTRLSKSYRLSIYGWSNFKLAVAELSTGELCFNRHGKDYKRLLGRIF